mmetsp:Transcript_17753/g.20518  ORF Transcript_17753/g.20518 Transcript_17753/m.20518 type:complete len:194 (-) Transcript_17753:48-629(-)
MTRILKETSAFFLRCNELLNNYKRPDAETYQRKFTTIKEQFQTVMEDIQRGEKIEISQRRKTQHIQEERDVEEKTEEYKQKMDLQIKVLEEADYIDEVIQDRQKDIDNISKIMSDIKAITGDFNIEVDLQGSKLEDLDSNMSEVALNTKEATKQLKQADKRSRSNGRCLLIIAIVIVLCIAILFAILFGTNAI